MNATATQNGSVLKGLANRLQDINGFQSSLISDIENRLHEILNRRPPATPVSEQKPQQGADDFTQVANMECEKLLHSNQRLENIMKHLTEIIG